MAKVLINLKDKLIDVTLIKTIEKSRYFGHMTQSMVYSIVINHNMPENVFIPKWKFDFNSEKERDEYYDGLKVRLSSIEYVKII